MGKKGRWFSAIKRVFTPHSKDKPVNEPEKKSSKERKKGHGNSFIPLFREPSSIEDILGEAERERSVIFRHPTPPQQPKTPPFVPPRASPPRGPTPKAASPRAASPRVGGSSGPSLRVASPKAASPRAATPSIVSHQEDIRYRPEPTSRSQHDSSTKVMTASPRAASPSIEYRRKEISYRPQPTLKKQHDSATKIQAACRGYMARRSVRALKGLVRLQEVVRGQNVQRQTTNAMKYMQLLVRVQSQIQLRRIQMLEGQTQNQYKNDKELESALGKWSEASEAGNNGEWDDSLLTKDEIEARLQRKVEAVAKRERAMSYAYSHQPWKSTPRSAQTDAQAGRFPLWWNWLERQLPTTSTPENQAPRNFQLTPTRPYSELRASPWPQSSNQNLDALTPKSTKSIAAIPSKLARTPPSSRTPHANVRYSRGRASGGESPFGLPLKDDDSLISCPPFSVPSYMTPTVSAKAKVRANSNPKERLPGTPGSESTRRVSFPLTQGIGSFKWNKGSFFSGKSSGSHRAMDKNRPLHSIGNLSMDSTVSSPAGIGRKPFNRFV